MNEAKTFMHFNSCVYEMSRKGKEYKALMKQKNNAIIFEDIRMSSIDADYVASEVHTIIEDFQGAFTEEMMESFKIYTLHPCTSLEDCVQMGCSVICVYGVALEEVPNDLYAPICTTGDLEERAAAIQRALQVKYRRVPVLLIAPMTDAFMFDLAISHVPPTAVVDMDKETAVMPAADPIDEMFTPSLNIDPTMPTLSDEERVIITKLNDYMDQKRQELLHDEEITVEELETKLSGRLDMEEAAQILGITVEKLLDILVRAHTIQEALMQAAPQE